ncbi:MAG: ABC transporter ATP-binding protein [Lacipirellulaceae bacterium]
MPDLRVTGLTKSYPTPAEPLVVLRGVDLELARGESLAVTGPSGSGKSTLLAILGTLDTPTSGEVRLAGEDPFALDEPRLARLRGERIGFVFQEHHLLPQFSALENVATPLLAAGSVPPSGIERARELLARVGLADRERHSPAQLSGGERQRVAIARALVREPLLVLADEPTGNLDPRAAEGIADLLLGLVHERAAMLVAVTHSEAFAARLGRRARLVDGALVE